MLRFRELDDRGPIACELGDSGRSVAFVRAFHVGPRFTAASTAEGGSMKQQPGYVRTYLHRGIARGRRAS